MTTAHHHGKPASDELAALRARVAELESQIGGRPDSAKPAGGIDPRLVESMMAGVVHVGLDGSLVYSNAEAQRILGLTYDELSRRYLADFNPLTVRDDGSPMPVEEYPAAQCLKTGQPQSPVTIGVQRPNGQMSWAVYNAAPMCDQHTGRMTAAVVTFVDITPIRQARDALRESEQRFTALADNSVVGFWQVTNDGRTLYVNQAMCRMIGVKDVNDLRGRSFRDFFTPSSLEIMAREHAKRPHGESSSYEVELVSRSGERRQVIISGAPVMSAQGHLTSMIGTFIDITERNRIEQEHCNAEEKYHSLFEHSPNGVLIADPQDGRIIESNQAFRSIVGYSVDQLAGMTLDQFESSESPESIRQRIQKVLTEGGDEFDAQVRSSKGDVRDITVRSKLFELRGERRIMSIVRDTTDRRKAQRELEVAEQRLRTIIDAAPLIIWSTDSKGVVTLSEGRALVGLGFQPGQLVGTNVFDLYSQVPEITEVNRRVLAGEAISHITTLGPTTLESRMSPLRDAQGNVTGMIGVAVDITDRHLAEQALWQSQQRLTSMVKHTPLAVITWNKNFEVMEWNPGAERIFRYSREEAIGKHASFIIHPRSRVHVDDVLKSLINQTGGSRSTNSNLTKDGRSIFCEWYNSPLLGPDGQLVGVASLCEDVTERLTSETALKHSEERLRSVFDSAVDPLWDWEVAADRTSFSPSWYRMLGYKTDELDHRSQTWQDMVHPEDRPNLTSRLQACLRGERPDFEAEFRVRTRSGGWVWALSRGRVVMRDKKQEPLRMIGSISDITERKRNEQKLRESYEFQRLMLNELDHRVRNNLASLSALIDLTARGTSDVRQLARSIKGRVDGMTSVHSILSRGHWHPIQLRDLLQAVMPTDVINAINIEGPPVLIGQRQVTALGMIFQELLANSLKYGALSAAKGSVRVQWAIGTSRPDALAYVPLEFTWTETGGPPPAPAPKSGVGTGLIEGLTRSELRGQAIMQFPPAHHRLVMMLDRVG